MSAFLKSALGIFVLSAAMLAGLGETNEAQARPYRGGYYGGYRGGYSSYYAPRYYNGYRYNSYRPYYGGYYGRPYGYYNNWYGPRNYIGVGPVRIGW